MLGETISHYRILEKLGQGGMGVVYRAEDTRLGRVVALKFLPPELSEIPEATARFMREARAVSRLQHNNICAIHEIDETPGGQLFLSMDCYEGETLRERLLRGPLSVDEVLSISVQIAQGLQHAHKSGVVHRDLKPGNLMITPDGVVKILDFGLARTSEETRVTRAGAIVGTVAYMSPEQAQGLDVDPRTDLWSLGAVMYEMLTGTAPFHSETPAASIHRILHDDPVPLSVHRSDAPPALEVLVQRLLTRNLNQRCASAEHILDSLVTRSSDSNANLKIHKPAKSRISRPVMIGAAVLVIVAVALAISGRLPTLLRGTADHSPRLAVLLFQGAEDVDGAGDLAAGFTEELMTNLLQIEGLGVLSRSAVNQYRDGAIDPRTVGEQLECDYVLEGAVRGSADALRITARMIDAARGTQVWGRSFDGTLETMFALQDSICAGIAAALGLTVPAGDSSALASQWRSNAEAYAYYLAGRQAQWDWGSQNGPMIATAARGWYEKALRVDPEYAPALVGMSNILILEREWEERFTPNGYTRALEMARTAQGLDEDLAEAWAAEGLALEVIDPDSARAAIEHAMELNPDNPTILLVAGRLYRSRGDHERAEDVLLEALERDADFLPAYLYLGVLHEFQGRFDDAHGILADGLQRHPGSMRLRRWRARLFEAQGDGARAESEYRSILSENPDSYESCVALARLAAPAEADSLYEIIVDRWRDVPMALDRAGLHFASRGDRNRAGELFREAAALDPFSLDARYHLALNLARRGRIEETEAAIEAIRSLWTQDHDAAFRIGRYYLLDERDYQKADEELLAGLQLAPASPRLLMELANLHNRQSRYSEAIALYEQSVSLNPRHYDAFTRMANMQFQAGQLEEAVSSAQAAIAIREDLHDAWYNLALAQQWLGRRHEAAVSAKRSAQFGSSSDRAGGIELLGIIQHHEGRFRQALASFKRAAEMSSNPTFYLAEVMQTALVLGDEQEARQACLQVIERSSDRFRIAIAMGILATIESGAGNRSAADSLFTKAQFLFEDVLERYPDFVMAIREAALLHARSGNEERARELVEEVVRRSPTSGLERQACAQALALIGDFDSAFEHLSSAIDLGYDAIAVLDADPELASLREDPRYEQIVGVLR